MGLQGPPYAVLSPLVADPLAPPGDPNQVYSSPAVLYSRLVEYKMRPAHGSGQTALPLKVGRRPLLHGGFVCESRYFRLDYKTQNVPSLQVRAVMENL